MSNPQISSAAIPTRVMLFAVVVCSGLKVVVMVVVIAD